VFGKDNITIFRDDYLVQNAACPMTEYTNGYWVEAKSNYKVYEWKITGGSFKDNFGQLKDKIIIYQNEIVLGRSYVTVIWNNVKSKDGKEAPKGTVTIDAYKNETLIEENIIGSGKREQEIKSLKDMIPPSLSSSASSPRLNFGEQEVRVFLSGAFNFPGIRKNGFPVSVTQYEWQIPAGWTAKAGSATPSGTYITSSAEIKLITDASSGGQVRVRGVNDCAGSGDYSEYSWTTFTRAAGIEFLEYPQTVPLGEVGTYKFSVMSLTGVSFEWEAPAGWSINGGGNTYTGGNVVQITTSECPTNQKVKVRMVQGDDISPSVEFPTTVALPAIIIPTGEIKQYQPATFSLDMPDTNIASVEWLVNGNPVGTVTNTSSLSFSINDSGKVKISAKLTLKGCSSVSIPEIEIDVAKAPDPVISGPSSVCDQATYTIENFNNLPPGATVQWSASNSNLTLISEQGTATAVFKKSGNGKSQIHAEISLGSQVITHLSFLVATEIKVSILGSKGMVGCGTTRIWTSSMTCLPLEPEGGLNIRWTLENKEQRFFGSGPDFAIRTTCKRSTSSVLRQPIDAPHAIYTLRLDVISPDGTIYSAPDESIEIFGYIEVLLGLNSNVLTVYPNPATDVVTVELLEEQAADADLSTQQTANTFSAGTYEIELWSATAMLKRFTTDRPVYQIPLSGLPAGIYFVRVTKDGETYTKKLIKR
jgi:hypothetical protein